MKNGSTGKDGNAADETQEDIRPEGDVIHLVQEERFPPVAKTGWSGIRSQQKKEYVVAEIKRILFAYEIAEISKDMAPWVNLIAKAFGAEVHVLHVIPQLDYYGVAYSLHPNRLEEQNELLSRAEQKVREFCEEHLRVPFNIAVQSGNPADLILKTIRSERISIAVLGTHGRKGLDRMIFGSVTDRVLRLSPVPVFCIEPSEFSSAEF